KPIFIRQSAKVDDMQNLQQSRRRIVSETLTVMFVDLVEYTKTTTSLTREHIDQLLNAFESIPMPVIARYGGTLVKKIGDALLVTFRSPTDAVLCGIALQHAFRRYNITNRLRNPLRIRVAIHSGEVLKRDNDVFGDAVNTASRIESIAKPGQVVFSDAVFSAMNKNEIPFVSLGWQQLRGLKYPVRLFRVRTREDAFYERRQRIRSIIRKVVAVSLVVILILLIGRFLWLNYGLSPQMEEAIENLTSIS
ncbi:MAG: adenylate/guanylate cyclase domain-containing protein, partial [Candidatus Woesearchaeota archaeon]